MSDNIQRKAILKLDVMNNLVNFQTRGLNLSFSVSPNITEIYSLDEVDTGYMVIQTNMGEEYIDLLGMLDLGDYPEDYKIKVEQKLSQINLEDVKLEEVEKTKETQIKQEAFLVMSNMAFLAKRDTNGNPYLEVVNLKRTTQVLQCSVYGGHIRLKNTNMSEINKYKILLYIERNKDMILRHLGLING